MKAKGTIHEGRYAETKLADKSKFNKSGNNLSIAQMARSYFVRWGNNNVVTCSCKFDRVHPVTMDESCVKCYNSKAKVPQPRITGSYTAVIGAVDLCDCLLSAYRPRVKGKKWWRNLFVNTI